MAIFQKAIVEKYLETNCKQIGNMKTTLLLPLFILLFLSVFLSVNLFGQSKYHVEVNHDKYDDFSTYTLDGNLIPSSGSSISFNARLKKKDSLISHHIIIQYYANDWLFIQSGNSLTMLLDGEKIRLYTAGSDNFRQVYSGGYVREKAYYSVTPETIKKIFSAQKVEFKLTGEQFYTERRLTRKNKENLERFYNEYIMNPNIQENPSMVMGKGFDRATKTAITSAALLLLFI
mgnify:CR=1 FL=1